MQDRDVPPAAEGATDGDGVVVRLIVADRTAAIASNIAVSTPPLWITATAPLWPET